MTHKGLVENISRSGEELAIRVNDSNELHHLWNNNGTWFVHYTVYPDALTAKRVRRSLKTKSLAEAIQRRNLILSDAPFIAAGI